MSRGIARLGDRTLGVCSEHGQVGGTIITGSSTNFINERKIARLGDTVVADCGHSAVIITASSTVSSTLEAGQKTARLGDQVLGPTYSGQIITASPNTFTS
jgi:hypothetical protein